MKKPLRLPIIPKWVRILIPSVVIVIWMVIGALGGPYFGKISEVSSNDQSTFLPASAESTKVNKQIPNFQDQTTLPALVVFSHGDQLIAAPEMATVQSVANKLKTVDNVQTVSPPVLSDDGKAALVVANVKSTADFKTIGTTLRQDIDQVNVAPLTYHVGGPAGYLYDITKAFAGIDGLLLGVALLVVFIILIIVYRSPILPFLVLLNSMFALCAATLIAYYLAKSGVVQINGQVQGILFILVIGAATDYGLLFVSRFREELTRHRLNYQAVLASWRRSIEPIAAAAGTVMVGLLCLLLSDLNSNKALGPVGAIGIAMALISALTFLPSLLLVFGRAGFWPRRPHFETENMPIDIPKKGLWSRVARLVERRDTVLWVGIVVVLGLAALGMLGLKANGVPESDLVLGSSDARDGQTVIDAHFPGGSGTPVQVIVNQNDMDAVVTAVQKDASVQAVSVVANNSPSGMEPLGTYEQTQRAQFLQKTGRPAAYPFQNATPKVVDGTVLLSVTIKESAYSDEAQQTVQRLRNDVHAVDASGLVGGISAVQLDSQTTALRDRAIIIPTVLAVITIILMLLLRSIIAPLLLLFTTVLSFAAALGVSALVFNHVFNFPGADPAVILYAFIFLVALGIDYNIFLMTRVREESKRIDTRRGVLIGLVVTGGVITSAGIVLAATFAALAVIPVLFLAQIAFIVAFGVLLDTIIVRSLLVPALIHNAGRIVWWPARRMK